MKNADRESVHVCICVQFWKSIFNLMQAIDIQSIEIQLYSFKVITNFHSPQFPMFPKLLLF